MKTSNSILSKELGLPLKKALKILNLLTHAGLITRIVTKEGAQIELTEKAEALFPSTSQTLYRENPLIPRQYYVYCFQILHLIRLSQ